MGEHTTTRTAPAKSSTGYLLPQLNTLDWVLLVMCGIGGVWLYHRSAVGVHYLWQWKEALELLFTPRADGSLPYFFQGLISTLRLSVWGISFALVFGTLLGLGRFSRSVWLRTPANAFIQLVRNIPPLVFVFIFYFFISNQLIPLLGWKIFYETTTANQMRYSTFCLGLRTFGKTLPLACYVSAYSLLPTLQKLCAVVYKVSTKVSGKRLTHWACLDG